MVGSLFDYSPLQACTLLHTHHLHCQIKIHKKYNFLVVLLVSSDPDSQNSSMNHFDRYVDNIDSQGRLHIQCGNLNHILAMVFCTLYI